jgi:predicted lipoprotein with Yx(FWY)xxD motif
MFDAVRQSLAGVGPYAIGPRQFGPYKDGEQMKLRTLGLAGRMSLVAGSIASLVALTFATPVAQATPSTSTGTAAVVVYRHWRSPVGVMLTTTKGRSLYIHPGGPCAGSCLQSWPALLMPKGATIPEGERCLSTVAYGSNHRLQVTYHSQRLYTFTGDHGVSVNGNGVAGFHAAAVTLGC